MYEVIAPTSTPSSRNALGTRSAIAQILDQRHAALLMRDVTRATRRAASCPCPNRERARRIARPGLRSARHACSSTIIVCTPVSISGCQCSGCGTPNSACDLREDHGATHSPRAAPRRTARGAGISQRLAAVPATRVRTRARRARRARRSLRISSIVSGATVKPSGAKRAAKRARRSTRTGSSTNAGGDACRSQRSRKSRSPPNGSTSAPVSVIPRDRVDRQVATFEILLQRHIGREAACRSRDSPAPVFRSVRASAYSSLVSGCRNTGKSLPTGLKAAIQQFLAGARRRRPSRARVRAGRAAHHVPRRRPR